MVTVVRFWPVHDNAAMIKKFKKFIEQLLNKIIHLLHLTSSRSTFSAGEPPQIHECVCATASAPHASIHRFQSSLSMGSYKRRQIALGPQNASDIADWTRPRAISIWRMRRMPMNIKITLSLSTPLHKMNINYNAIKNYKSSHSAVLMWSGKQW